MKTSKIFALLLSALLFISLAACVKSIPSKQASPTKTGQPGATKPGPTGVMEQIYQFATQTAMAGKSEAPGTPAVAGTPGEPIASAPAAPQTNPPPQPTTPPTPKPTVMIPTPTPGLPKTYTIQRGEFPYCIARRFNIDPAALLKINGMGGGSFYYEGMILKIPQDAKPFPGNRTLHAHPTTYTVKSGDSIYSIACYFGDVDPYAIALANGLKEPYKLGAGDIINIP